MRDGPAAVLRPPVHRPPVVVPEAHEGGAPGAEVEAVARTRVLLHSPYPEFDRCGGALGTGVCSVPWSADMDRVSMDRPRTAQGERGGIRVGCVFQVSDSVRARQYIGCLLSVG